MNPDTTPGIDIEARGNTAAPDHAARRHHRYGMSKLNAFRACAGYEPRDSTNAAAEDGTRLHEVMDIVIERVKVDPANRRLGTELTALLGDGVVAVSEEEQSWLATCCKEADFWLDRCPAVELYNEIKVFITRKTGEELNHGHTDLVLIVGKGKAVIFDWKFGWLPVPPAETNLQGMGYALGSFEKFPRIQSVGVIFVQPKLNKTTVMKYGREDMPDMFNQIATVIDRAEMYRQGKLEGAEGALRPNPYCDYCLRAGTCPALVKQAATALSLYEALPMPAGQFSLEHIKTPEQIAKALYVIDRLEALLEASKKDENGIKGIRRMALDLAKASETGKLEIEIAPGQVVVLSTSQRKHSRSINHPELVAQVVEDTLTLTQVLACCDMSVTQIEESFAEARVAKADEKADAILKEAENILATGNHNKETTKRLLAEAKARAKETRTTKKAAKELLTGALTAEGLMVAAEGSIDVLKVRLEHKTPQLSAQPN